MILITSLFVFVSLNWLQWLFVVIQNILTLGYRSECDIANCIKCQKNVKKNCVTVTVQKHNVLHNFLSFLLFIAHNVHCVVNKERLYDVQNFIWCTNHFKIWTCKNSDTISHISLPFRLNFLLQLISIMLFSCDEAIFFI